MKSRKLIVLVALVLMFSMSFGAMEACAKTLKQINSEIEEKEEALEEGREKEAKLQDEIEKLEVKIGEKENKISSLEGKIDKTESNITEAEIDLKEAEEKVAEQNKNLDSRLRAMYKNGTIGFIDVVLGSESVGDLISNIDMVQKVFSNDKDVLADLEQASRTLEEKKQKLEKLQASLRESKVEIAAEKQTLTADKEEVAEKKSEVAADNEELHDNIQELEQEADRIIAIINNDSSSNSNSTYGGGVFTWPVPGHTRISSQYGWRTCPFHGREKHSGLDIPAPYGTPVKAAADGTVISSGYLGSYGNAVIISHGSSLYTLYGHNSSLVVSSGTKVKKGDTIAKVGSTGSSTGNHCHFEVRKGGNSYGNDVNPWTYLK